VHLRNEPRERPAGELFDALLLAADRAGVGLAVVQIAPELRVIFASERCAQILGISVADMLENVPLHLFARDERAHMQYVVGRHREGDLPPPVMETRIVRPDGREVVLELAVGATTIEGQPASVVFVRDGTGASLAKETLRRSESRWRALIETAPDGIVLLRDRKIVYANSAAAILLDCENADALKGCTFAEFLHEEDFRAMGERIAALRPGGLPIGPYEYRARSRKGRAIVVEVTSILVDDEDGPAVIGFARDVTESRRLQAQLVRADRLAALGTMAAGVAHEINNPLAFMLLGLDAIQRHFDVDGSIDEEAVRATMEDVRHGVERIASIARQLHTFSRGEEESPVSRATDLVAVLERVCRMVAREVHYHGTLDRRFDSLPPVRGDMGRLEQVFLNILLNAAQALDATRSDGRVQVVARSDGDRVVVTVSDNGGGISAENLGRVFDPFFSTKPIGSGTGLGLSICHTIITQIGGEIAIESRAGAGTSVKVTLPVADPITGNERRSDRNSIPAAPRARILIVDDEEAFLRALRRVLGRHHDTVLCASSGEAMRHIADGNFDLVLLDVMMPMASGIELLEHIRRSRPALLPAVVFMTGGATRESVERFLANGTVPVLRKPFAIEEIEALLRERRAS
jgi:PAS domain S-box-containing protein